MSRWFKNAAAFSGGLIIMGLIIWGTSGDFTQTVQQAAEEELVIIDYEGGLCQEAGGTICQNRTTIFGNGKVTYTNNPVENKITSKELIQIRTLLEETDLTNLTSDPTALCPSAYDGQDISLTFPSEKGDQRYKLCQIKNWETNKLFAYVTNLAESKL